MSPLIALGGPLLLVVRSMRQHLLSTIVTMLSVALASGLVMSVFAISTQTREAFTGGPIGFDAVLGARGSPLQLVLNTVFHLETSPGNIPWSLYQTIRKRPYVKLAVPYAVGDNYRGYRIVGTTLEMMTEFEYRAGRKFRLRAGGRYYDEQLREAVVGSVAAAKTGLRVGDRFNPYHGLQFAEEARHDEEYVVVGVLEPTNSPSDRVIWIPIEGVFRMGGHVLRGAGKRYVPEAGVEIPDEHKEISAVMLKLKSPQAGMLLDQEVNRQGNVATLAWPIATVMADLFNKLGWASRVLELVAYLVVVVAAASILASIYNSINERRRDFAILRALGARRATVFASIVLEAGTIALLGALLGYVVYAGIVGIAAYLVHAQTGVVLDVLGYHPALWLTPLGMALLGALSGVLPALKAYATDVAANLAPVS
jgi:putative ABC transport system permease protein